jgi:hypothetical protein
MARTKTQRRTPPKKKTAARKIPSPYAGIKVVRELRSGYSSYEIVNAVNDLLQRGWILLGAQFIGGDVQAGERREFLYVLGSTDPALAEVSDESQFADLEASVRDWSSNQ